MPARLIRRLIPSVALLALAAVPIPGGASEQAVDVPDDGRLYQVFHPGSYDGGPVEPEEIPICTGKETDPPDCFDGELFRVEAHYIGRDAAEPTVGILEDGTAFMAAAAYDSSLGLPRTFVMRSTDGGATWSDTGPKLPGGQQNPPVTLDPWVQVDPDTGRVFNLDLTLACSYLSFSDDRGETWTTNPLACGQPINDHQTIVVAPPPPGLPSSPLYENYLYYCFNRVVDASCSRSLDGGLTWHPTGMPAYLGYAPGNGAGFYGVEGFCGGLHGHVKADGEGRIFIPRGYCDQPYLAVSEDGGTTWFQTRVADELSAARGHVAEHFSVAADDAGNVYYLWRDEEHRLSWLAISRDHGRTFGEPMLVSPPGVEATNFATIAAGEEGKIAMVFPGTTDADADRPPWSSYVVVSDDVLSDDPTFLATTANPLDDPIHRGGCNGRCGGMLDFLDIDVSAADGRVWAAVVDTCTQLANCVGGGSANDAEGVAVRQVGGPVLGAGA